MSPALTPSWLDLVGEEFEKPYMKDLKAFLVEEKQSGTTVFPKGSDIFNALNHTPVAQVKVVILGQDPYHGVGQAHGLSFSVQKGVAVPPSLKNMYKELSNEFPDFKIPSHGNLTEWADQGVLLLNATLTVRAHTPGSHQKRGWETFTDRIISELSKKRNGLVFLLWGKYAQQKEVLIDSKNHLILKSAHPSPFSAHSGFFGCNHFIKANNYLQDRGEKAIKWQISS
ncbi:MAG: uracil-DNA glycosylase [Pedobacter sp.]|nr:MAG: uracil-DNA glycosylase [Pedobacter sp.]